MADTKNAKLQREQFRLMLACAKTVHRCQGDTLQKAVVQLPNERRNHIHYVALSRVTALDKLHILPPFDTTTISVSKEVCREIADRTPGVVVLHTTLYFTK